jgi:hypothetical protein
MEYIQNSINNRSNLKMLIFTLILIVSLCMFMIPILQPETKSLAPLEGNTAFSPNMYGHLRNLQKNNEAFDPPTSINTNELNNKHIYKGKWKSEQEVFNFGDIREGQLIGHMLTFRDVNGISGEKIAIYFMLLEGEFIDNWVDIRSQASIDKKAANINTLTISNITKYYYSWERFHSKIIYGKSIFNSYVANSKY